MGMVGGGIGKSRLWLTKRGCQTALGKRGIEKCLQKHRPGLVGRIKTGAVRYHSRDLASISARVMDDACLSWGRRSFSEIGSILFRTRKQALYVPSSKPGEELTAACGRPPSLPLGSWKVASPFCHGSIGDDVTGANVWVPSVGMRDVVPSIPVAIRACVATSMLEVSGPPGGSKGGRL
jgi:hypothetical protein